MTMKQRPKVERAEQVPKGGLYFHDDSPLGYIKTGSTLLDLVLGGGYPLGRIVNIVGDESTGKTLLAMEAFANFKRQFPKGKSYFDEAEAAFDDDYIRSLGIPLDDVEFVKDEEGNKTKTVEQWYENLCKVIEKHEESGTPALYVLDSLDALSDVAEMDRGFEEGTYGTGKAKNISKLFRMLVSDIERTKICVIIISQVRDKIGATFGKKKTRAGGKALNFYASQALWLAHKEDIKGTWKGNARQVGVKVRAKCEKNKVSLPGRECDFRILFGYGVDDERSCIDWLASMKGVDTFAGLSKDKAMIEVTKNRKGISEKLREQTIQVWQEFDDHLAPPKEGKYG